MSENSSWHLQKSIQVALSADADLQIIIGDPARIYDEVTEEAIYPYLTMGGVKITPYDGHNHAYVHEFHVHAWSNYAGRREVKAIIDQVHNVLHDADLVIEGHKLVSIRFIFSDIFRKPDGETYHAVMRYRAITVAEGA